MFSSTYQGVGKLDAETFFHDHPICDYRAERALNRCFSLSAKRVSEWTSQRGRP